MQKKILFIVCVILIAGASIYFVDKNQKISSQLEVNLPSVIIGAQKYTVDIADTPLRQSQGLSGRSSLTPNTGMLFVFDTPGDYGFWMKDMLFSIDIIWIGEDKKITYIEKNATPGSYPESFSSPDDSLYVLEIPAGDSEKYNFSVGQKTEIFY